MTDQPAVVDVLGVRRWGEDDVTPVVIDTRAGCGDRWSDHFRKGCIGIAIRTGRGEGLIHLTSADALRLSDLLRAMADVNEAAQPAKTTQETT